MPEGEPAGRDGDHVRRTGRSGQGALPAGGRHPQAEFHFQVGRALAERLAYPAELLDCIPAEALAPSPGSATTSTSPG